MARRSRRSPGFTLVLGGGGSTGLAYMCGALRALEETTGLRPNDAELMIGTSAGSIMAADLALGKPLDDVLRSVHPDFEERPEIVRAWRSVPDLSRRMVGSLWVASRSVVPMSVTTPQPPACMQRLFPGSLLTVAGETPWQDAYPEEWPATPIWVTTSDLDGQRRIVLDRTNDEHVATFRQALRASCAVPGVYAPVRVDGLRLVDGGMASVTNLDLAASAPSDVVIALAPMAFDPNSPPGRLQSIIRSRANAQLRREGDHVRRAGKRLLILRPNGAELEHHGLNFLSNAGNDTIERLAYEHTVETLSTDRVRVLLGRDFMPQRSFR